MDDKPPKILKKSTTNIKNNLQRLTKNKSKPISLASNTKSCSVDKVYEDYFFSSAHKIDYSAFFLDESEFTYTNLVVEKDEVFEESPDELPKKKSTYQSLDFANIQKQESNEIKK